MTSVSRRMAPIGRLAALLVWVLWGCGSTVRYYRPSRVAGPSVTTVALEHGVTTVSLPPPGMARGVSLADGFPVWVVRHQDNTVSILSAVAPTRPTRQGIRPALRDVAQQIDRSLVSWIPSIRRFVGGSVVFDEQGHALGYADFDACAEHCPRVENLPQAVRDLDAFTLTVLPESDAVQVGRRIPGEARRPASTWLPWRRGSLYDTDRTARNDDMRAAEAAPTPPVSVDAALALADGRYALVEGDVVRSTDADPAFCVSGHGPGECGTCAGNHLPLVGIPPTVASYVDAREFWRDPSSYHRELHDDRVAAEPGTFLVRRHGSAFALVAGNFAGICSR